MSLIRAFDPQGILQGLQCDAQKQLKVAISGAGSGGTSAVDQAAFTAGVSAGTPAMGVYEASPTTLTDGQVGLIGLTNDRKVKVSGSLTVSPTSPSTPSLTAIAAATSSQTALASTAGRLGVVYFNNADKSCYLKYGTTASATSFTKKLFPGESWEPAINYTGRVDVIWDSGVNTGLNLNVTELTA